MNVLDLPRYQENPFHLFFETYVLDVIGALPQGRDIDAGDVERVFGPQCPSWRDSVRTALRLSETIEVAMLDAWHRWADKYDDYEPHYRPFAFAQDFVDRYFQTDSRVDVWGEGELERARERADRSQAA